MLTLSGGFAARRSGPPPAKQPRTQPPPQPLPQTHPQASQQAPRPRLQLSQPALLPQPPQPAPQPPPQQPAPQPRAQASQPATALRPRSSAAAPLHNVRPAGPLSAASQPSVQRVSAPQSRDAAGLDAADGMPPLVSQQQRQDAPSQQMPPSQHNVSSQRQPSSRQRPPSQPQQQQRQRAPGPAPVLAQSPEGVDPSHRMLPDASQGQPQSQDEGADPPRPSQPGAEVQVIAALQQAMSDGNMLFHANFVNSVNGCWLLPSG